MLKLILPSVLPVLLCVLTSVSAQAQVRISEIMYHPVEKEAFDTNGTPLLDLSNDVHEFVELHNAGPGSISLEGWRLAGGIGFTFGAGTTIAPGGFLVVGKNPTRLAAIASYSLTTNQTLGPFSGQLGNDGDTVRLVDNFDTVVDAAAYSPASPWAIGADALGADDEWTGLNSAAHQYRGRSLERVSFSHASSDPANWLASPLATGPTPGRVNSVQLAVPRPVVSSRSIAQAGDGSLVIRSNQPVRLDVAFTATNQLANVSVEYFVDDINLTNEVRSVLSLTPLTSPSDGRYTATLPGFSNRQIVRYRIRADRGSGVEPVSPRADDPFAWHAFFITPTRASVNPVYECFISTASLNTLTTNIAGSPRRVTLPDPPGLIRESWNDSEPAIFVHNGEVIDIQMRHHGSRYNRGAGRNSWKWQFPRYHRFNGRDSYFITDKGEEHRVGSQLYDAADFPAWRCRYVDVFLNNGGQLQRLQQEELDSDTYRRWDREQADKYPGRGIEGLGGIFKATGVIPFESGIGQGTTSYFGSGEGPYFIGNGALPPAKPGWSVRQRCEWTYGAQIDGWKGGGEVEELLAGFWTARGDSPVAPNPDALATRAFLEANFDVDMTLTYMAIRDWAGPFDNATHNHFLWRRANGRWAMAPWDLDSEFDTPTQPIFWDEQVVPQPDGLRGPHWIKDAFYKAFRNEYRQKLWLLNNTLLNASDFATNGWNSLSSFASGRQTSVNSQLGLGTFYRPARPVNLAPASGDGAVPPAELQSSAYVAGNSNAPAPHASTTWMIRHPNGGYTNPVVRVTSTTNLTALAIPFGKLTFGETYFWRCVHTDADGHPSPPSAETPFVFGASPLTVPLVLIDAATLWRYDASGTNHPVNWTQPAFDDSAWLAGPALLADETALLPEPIRTALVRSNQVTYRFRTSFLFNGDTNGLTLRLRQVIDDGVAVYLNGTEVSRTGLPAGALAATTFANRSVNDAVMEGPLTIPSSALRIGTNVIAAEVHQNASHGNDIVFGLALEARVPAVPGAVRLSEILAENRASVLNGNYAPDYIELHNTSGVPQSLEQFSLSDNPERPGKFVFPAGTVIPANGYLVVWCDEATNAPGLHAGFALDNDGQTVALFAVTPGGYQLADVVTFGLQVSDMSIGRIYPGGNAPAYWALGEPTPGTANSFEVLGDPAVLRINEWMATVTGGPDWFEIYNPNGFAVALAGLYLTDNITVRTNTRIAPLTFIAAGGHRQFIADQDLAQGARHVNFRLSGGGESIVLSGTNLATIDAVTFGSQLADVSQGRLPDGGASLSLFPGSASPEARNRLAISGIVINELIPDLELHNTGATPADISSWWLSDDDIVLQKYQIPPGTIVPPGGYWFVDDDELPFDLRRPLGGRVYLSHDGTHILSRKFGPWDGWSQGIVQTSVGTDFERLASQTFGSANSAPEVGPVVISEVQYHPPTLPGDDDDYEFIELANISGAAVPLFDEASPELRWRLRDGVSFTFASGVTLAAGEHVLVLPFDPVTNAVALSNFTAVYALRPTTRLFGPYSGRLQNSGNSVELVRQLPPVALAGPDFGVIPEVLMDRVNYSDTTPWPAAADGLGSSLQRRVLASYGNDPTNWIASGVSPGGVTLSNLPPAIAITAPLANAALGFGLDIAITAGVNDTDGTISRVEFFVDGIEIGVRVTSPFSLVWTNARPGPHTLQARAFDNRLGITTSAAIPVTVVNQAPGVSVSSPTNGAFYLLPGDIALSANATDSDGAIVRVEYFANGALIGRALTAPFNAVWTNVAAGSYAITAVATDNGGGVTTSAGVNITARRVPAIAYVVPPGTVGSQAFANGYGMDFDVKSNILVTTFGVFDSAGDGLTNVTLTTQIYRRTNNTGTVIATLAFTGTDQGTLIGGSRFKPLPTPLALGPGNYTLVSYGYNAANPGANIGTGNTKTWSTDDGGGLIEFVGASRYGSGGPGTYPTTIDAGPVDRYGAGTFEFRTPPDAPIVIASPTDRIVKTGGTTNFSASTYGVAPLRYQWQFEGNAISGATNATLVISNAQFANGGGYRLVVANSFGAVTTAVAQLTIWQDAGIVQPPLSQSVVVGAPVTLSVTMLGTPRPYGVEWRRGSATIASNTVNEEYSFISFNAPLSPTNQSYRVIVRNLANQGVNSNVLISVTTLADTDGDRMADEWEVAYGFSPTNGMDGGLDSDGDGVSNASEHGAGTDPTDPANYFRIDPPRHDSPATVRFGAVSNRTYAVQFRDELNPAFWLLLARVPARSTNHVVVVTDPGAATNRFYRVATPVMP